MFNIEATTVDNEEEGSWAHFKGSQFLIASSGSTKFQRMFAKLQVPHRRAIQKNRLDPNIQLDLMARAMSKTLLLDWKDVVDSSGNDVEFNIDVAYNALLKNSELRDFVTEYATDLANYIEEERDDLGKPVEKSSTGKPSSENEKSS